MLYGSDGSACVELQLWKLDNESVGQKKDRVSRNETRKISGRIWSPAF